MIQRNNYILLTNLMLNLFGTIAHHTKAKILLIFALFLYLFMHKVLKTINGRSCVAVVAQREQEMP